MSFIPAESIYQLHPVPSLVGSVNGLSVGRSISLGCSVGMFQFPKRAGGYSSMFISEHLFQLGQDDQLSDVIDCLP